jgi:hypothetical protein
MALILIISLLAFGMLVNGFTSHAASTTSGYWIKNIVTFNTFGQFEVNETLYQTTNSTTGLSSVTLVFPSEFAGHIVAISLHGKSNNNTVQVTESTSVSNNNTVSMALSVSPNLQPGSNSSISLGFYVLNTFQSIADGNYTAPILFSPGVSMPLDNIVTSIVLPYLTTHIVDPTPMQEAGFSHTVGTNATLETWDYSGPNVSSTVRSGQVEIFSTPDSSGALDFSSAIRQLSVASNGQVIVTDTLNMHNFGENTIYSLSYSPLTNSSSLIAVPTSEPPLSNLESIPISGDILDLNSTGQAIQPDSSASLVYQYPLGQQFWSYSNGNYIVSIPTTTPIQAVFDRYQITSSTVPGIVVSGNQLSLDGFNTTEIQGSANLTYRVGIASAFGSALPIAGLLFIAVFVGAVVFKPKQEQKEESSTTFDSLTKAFEDKVSNTNEILSELKGRGTSVSRNEVIVARSRIDDFRIKTNSRIGTLRAQLADAGVTVQSDLNEVLASDREFDRVVKDVLNNYDQLLSRKMKEETFTRLQHSNERRLQSVMNSLLDQIHDLKEEYESEG